MSESNEEKNTEVGNYFISNYPPFSVWSTDQKQLAMDTFNQAPTKQVDLGLYFHIPFCRKRCKFCYYRVYTDKNRNERDVYLDALLTELTTLSNLPVLKDRNYDFLYVGGGTPSALHEDQIDRLGTEIRKTLPLDELKEVTFECEPGTMTERKVEAIKRFGCTRLSLGVEHFDPHVLEENGRAHGAPEIFTAYDWVKQFDFDQVNIDLIAGMVDETDATWTETIQKAITLSPDSITVYQMELPYNTVYSKQILEKTGVSRVADWETKRRWADEAFSAFCQNGYVQSSAYTVVKAGNTTGFSYRDALWTGADLVAAGVASFGHIQGIHYQNDHNIDPYNETAQSGELPIYRAYKPTADQSLIREMILQLKLGHISTIPFQEKFGINILEKWSAEFEAMQNEGMATIDNDQIVLTNQGLLQVDGLLPRFYEPEHANKRYA